MRVVAPVRADRRAAKIGLRLYKIGMPWPLEPEGVREFCTGLDRVLVIDVDTETQLARTIARDGISREQAQSILAAQATRQQRLAVADDIIDNSGAAQGIEPRVAALHRRYLELAATAPQQD